MTEENIRPSMPPQTEEKNPLGRESVVKLLLKFAIPSIVAMLVNSLYNIVDQIFIGQGVGKAGNAATTVAFPLVTLSLSVSLLIGAGCAAFYNLKLGQGDRESAAKAVGNALTLMGAVSVLFLVFGLIFVRPLLNLFGKSTPEVMDYAVDYSRVIIIGLPFAMAGTALSHMIRADGSPKYSMAFMLVGAVLNTVLDPIFIFVFHWGVEGAAWATVIGQVVSFFMAAVYLKHYKNIKLKRKHFKLSLVISRMILSLGIAYFITQMSFFVLQIVMNNTLTKYGAVTDYGTDIPLAVSGIVMKVSQILISVLIGISQGSQPIIGFNYGARQFDRVKKTYVIAALAATVLAIIGWGVFLLFPKQITDLFGRENELYTQFSVKFFKTYLLCIFVVGFQVVSSNFFQAAGKPMKAALLNLSRTIVFLVPLILILPLKFGIDGVLYAGPIADAASAILAGVLIAFEMRQLTQKHRNTLLSPPAEIPPQQKDAPPEI